jgi:hypothetical protein
MGDMYTYLVRTLAERSFSERVIQNPEVEGNRENVDKLVYGTALCKELQITHTNKR